MLPRKEGGVRGGGGAREVGTPGISECCGWPFWGLHCSRLSSYPLADTGKAGSTYSAYSNAIQKADFAVLWQRRALAPTQRAILSSCQLSWYGHIRANNLIHTHFIVFSSVLFFFFLCYKAHVTGHTNRPCTALALKTLLFRVTLLYISVCMCIVV